MFCEGIISFAFARVATTSFCGDGEAVGALDGVSQLVCALYLYFCIEVVGRDEGGN